MKAADKIINLHIRLITEKKTMLEYIEQAPAEERELLSELSKARHGGHRDLEEQFERLLKDLKDIVISKSKKIKEIDALLKECEQVMTPLAKIESLLKRAETAGF